MASSVQKLKLKDRKTIYIANGCIHKIENTSSLSTTIPTSIIQICLLYFVQLDYFEKCGDKLSITGQQKNIITRLGDFSFGSWSNIGYGFNWIESIKHVEYC